MLASVAMLSVLSLVTACGRSEFDDIDYPSPLTDSGADLGDDVLPDDVLPDTEPDVPPIDCDVITTLVIEPAGTKVPIGSTAFFAARALCPDGSTRDVTALAAWASDNPKVADRVGPGSFYAYNAGSARITASYLGFIAEAKLSVTDDSLVDLRIDPGGADLAVGGSQKFAATAFYASGASVDVTGAATWISDNPTVARISAPGLVTGVSGGFASIRAVFGARTGYAKINVTGRTLKSVEISPLNPTIGVGVTINMTATAIYSDGTKGDVTSSAAWTSNNTSVASVALFGGVAVVRGESGGVADIRAFFGGLAGLTPVTVTSSKLTSITLSPPSATIAVDASIGIKATANYSDGSAVDITATAFWKSTDPTIANVAVGVVKGVKAGTTTITATFGGLSANATVTVSPAKLLSITVTPASATAPLGSRVAFKAQGNYEGGAVRDVTADVTWSTDDAAIASISNAAVTKGELTPVALGGTLVRAKLDGLEGVAKVTVTAASVTGITISPNPLAMTVGTKQLAKATAKYSDGTSVDVTTTCTWSTGNAAIATVSNAAGAQGQVAAVAAGTTSLSCTQGGITGSGTINVTGATLAQVTVSPIAPTCRVGDVLQFQATAISTAGTSTNVTAAAMWSSSAPSVVLYTGNPGRFRCIAKGTATVSAAYGGRTGSSPVTVTDAVAVSIQVDPVGVSIAVGTVQQYQATVLMSDGTSRNVTLDPGTTWSSSAPAVANISTIGGTKGRATALSAGTTTIRATFSGLNGTATLTVTSAKVVAVQISPPAPRVPAGVTFNFTATAVYSDGTSMDVTGAATWVSSNGAILAVSNAAGSKGSATSFAAGSATVTATYSGVSGSAPVTVTNAKLLRVQLTPFNPTLAVGFGVRLTATAVWDDGTTANVTGQSTWTSSNAAVASVSTAAGSRGRVTPVAPGKATISAQYNGMIGSTVVTVSSATLSSMVITPNPAGVAVSGSQQLTATGSFSDGTSLDVTDYVGWGSSDPSVADVSNAVDTKGIVYGFKTGTVTITATRGSVVGKATATVK